MTLTKFTLTQNRIYGLDIMRCCAITLVLVNHSSGYLSDNPYLKVILANTGGYGVTLFFVLSGFLIGRILIKQFSSSKITSTLLFSFWARRWLRTLPAYFFILTLLVIISAVFADYDPHGMWTYYVFLQNFNTPIPAFFAESWSLSIEEWFYIIVPLSLFLLQRVVKTTFKFSIISIATTIMIIVVCFRYYRFINLPLNGNIDILNNFHRQVITRLDSLMYGVIGALVFFYYPKWVIKKQRLFFLGILLITMDKILSVTFNHYHNLFYSAIISCTIVPAGGLFLIPLLSSVKNGKGTIYRLVTFISVISYSLYLVNSTLVHIIIDQFSGLIVHHLSKLLISILQFGCFWIFTFVFAISLNILIEKPFMRLRNRL